MSRFDIFQHAFSSCGDSIGGFVSRRTVSCILLPILVSGLFCIRILFPIQLMPDYVDNYLPTKGKVAGELQNLKQYFEINDNATMYALRRYEYERVGYIVVKGNNDSSVIELLTLVDIIKLWKAIIDIPIYDYHETHTYNSICVKIPNVDECVASPLLGLIVYRIGDIFNLSYPVHNVQDFGEIFVGNLVGGITWYPNDTRGIIYQADAILLPYMLKHSSAKYEHLAKQWELKLSEFLTGANNKSKPDFELAWYTSETIEAETVAQGGTIGLVIAAIVIGVTIVMVASSFSCSVIKSQPFAAVCAMLSTIAALATSIFLVILCGVPYSSMGKLAPLTAFLVAIQNYFILQRCWCRSCFLATTKERIRFAYRKSFGSILAVTLVNLAAFLSTIFIPIPAVQSFGIFGSVSTVVVFFYHLLLTGAFMTLCGRREQGKKHFFSCDPVPDVDTPCATPAPIEKLKKLVSSGQSAEGPKENLAVRFFCGPFASLIMSPISRIVVVLSFIAYVGVTVWGCYSIPMQIEQSTVVPRSSYAQKSFRYMDTYFSDYCDYVHVWFDQLEHYPLSVLLLQQLQTELSRFENTKFTASAENWIEELHSFAYNSSLSLDDETLGADDLKTLFKRFLVNSKSQNFRSDFVFNEAGDMVAARFVVRLKNCHYHNQTAMMYYIMDIASSSNLSAHAYHYYFSIAEQNELILSAVLQSAIAVAVVTLVVSLLFIPIPVCSLLVVLCFIAADLGIVGFLSHWDIHFEFSSILTTVMCVGCSVNFPFHVVYHFTNEYSADKRQRLQSAFASTATPVLLSTLASLLSVACISLMDNYASHVIAKALFLGILLPVYLSLVVLPTALVSLIPNCLLFRQ